MANRTTRHRMFRNSLIVLLIFTGIGVVLQFAPGMGTTGFGSAFGLAFVFGGLVWLVVAYLSGGFVSTYVAPVPANRSGNPLLYTLPAQRRAEVTLPGRNPEVVAELREKMADQPGAMIVAFLLGLALFGLAAVFYLASVAGAIVLAIVITAFTLLFLASRPRRRPAPEA